ENRKPKGLLENSSIFLPLSPPCSALPQHLGYRQSKSVRAVPSLAVSVRSGTRLSVSLWVDWVSRRLLVRYQAVHAASGIFLGFTSLSLYALRCVYSAADVQHT